jgi:DNA-binding transcriptional ArsR family regulator
MPVVKLRTHRDRQRADRLQAARAFLSNIAGDDQLLGRVIGQIDRELAPGGGWRFVMTEPDLNTFVVDSLALTSKRPIKAMRLWAHLIRAIDRDSNEVKASRQELAKGLGIAPGDVSKIMGELEAIGAVYKRRDGRFARYFVNENVATHLTGAIRDRAQAEAPRLRLVETEPG